MCIDNEFIEAALIAIENNEVGKLTFPGAQYFTFPYEGDDMIFGEDIRDAVEAALGEPLVETVLPGLEAQVTLVPKSTIPASDRA